MTLFHKILYGTASLLLVVLAIGALVVTAEVRMTNRHLQSLLTETQAMVAEVRPELRETLKQAKITAFESRGDFKAFMEDFNSIENMRGRRATMRAGESVAALAARIEADTLPLVNQSLRRSDEAINAAKGLISNADQSLNRELLPEATKLLASLRQTSDAFGVEGRAILAEILVLTKQGQTSLEAVNKVLGSPEWLSILKSLDGTAKNIEATSAAMPAIAQSVEKIAQTSAKFTKAILIAQLLATIAGALIP